MGNHLIHIYDRDSRISYPLRHKNVLSHCLCRQKLSEIEIFQLFISPNNFKNRIDYHLRPSEDLREVDAPHRDCVFRTRREKEMLDLRLLHTSPEIRKQATKLIYQTNTFSFDTFRTLKRWLQTVPSHLLAYVQHLNIEMPMKRATVDDPTGPKFNTARWTALFSADINEKLPRIKTLSVAVLLEGLVTCWRNTTSRKFTDTFRPLRQLKHLRDFTIVINENRTHDSGKHDHCADPTHDKTPRYSFWERKELRKVWAEEIREMVLGNHREYATSPNVDAICRQPPRTFRCR